MTRGYERFQTWQFLPLTNYPRLNTLPESKPGISNNNRTKISPNRGPWAASSWPASRQRRSWLPCWWRAQPPWGFQGKIMAFPGENRGFSWENQVFLYGKIMVFNEKTWFFLKPCIRNHIGVFLVSFPPRILGSWKLWAWTNSRQVLGFFFCLFHGFVQWVGSRNRLQETFGCSSCSIWFSSMLFCGVAINYKCV